MPQTILCPMCSEDVSAEAKTCPHGHENLTGVWREKMQLVMRKDAQLPNRCVKSNHPAETHLQCHLSWLPAWTLMTNALTPITYIIVALIFKKTASVEIGLTNKWAAKRRTATVVCWLGGVIGIGCMLGGSALPKDAEALTLVGGLTILGGSVIYGICNTNMVTAVKMTDDHIWLKGVCEDYLDELPVWDE